MQDTRHDAEEQATSKTLWLISIMELFDPFAAFDRRICHCRLTYAHSEQEARSNLQAWLDEQQARYPVVEIRPCPYGMTITADWHYPPTLENAHTITKA